jgi:hypothetical protein
MAMDGFRASSREHPIQDGHADGNLDMLGIGTACSQSRFDQCVAKAFRR